MVVDEDSHLIIAEPNSDKHRSQITDGHKRNTETERGEHRQTSERVIL